MSGRAELHAAAAATFETRPSRPTLSFRDLGIAAVTEGRVTAQVVRATAPSDTPQAPHRHDVELQFFYVLAGSMTVDHDGTVRELGPGDVVVQPGGVVHRILRHSADLELLEVSAPAGYGTEVVT